MYVTEPADDFKATMPRHNCLMVSPANVWGDNVETFRKDAKLVNTIFKSQHGMEVQSSIKGTYKLANFPFFIFVKYAFYILYVNPFVWNKLFKKGKKTFGRESSFVSSNCQQAHHTTSPCHHIWWSHFNGGEKRKDFYFIWDVFKTLELLNVECISEGDGSDDWFCYALNNKFGVGQRKIY